MRFGVSDLFQVAEMYEILLDATLSDPNLAHGREDTTFAKTVNISSTTWQKRIRRHFMIWERERALIRQRTVLMRFRSTLG